MKKILITIITALFLLAPAVSVHVHADETTLIDISADVWSEMTDSQKDLYLKLAIEQNGGSLPGLSIQAGLSDAFKYECYSDLLNGNENAKVSLELLGVADFKLGNFSEIKKTESNHNYLLNKDSALSTKITGANGNYAVIWWEKAVNDSSNPDEYYYANYGDVMYMLKYAYWYADGTEYIPSGKADNEYICFPTSDSYLGRSLKNAKLDTSAGTYFAQGWSEWYCSHVMDYPYNSLTIQFDMSFLNGDAENPLLFPEILEKVADEITDIPEEDTTEVTDSDILNILEDIYGVELDSLENEQDIENALLMLNNTLKNLNTEGSCDHSEVVGSLNAMIALLEGMQSGSNADYSDYFKDLCEKLDKNNELLETIAEAQIEEKEKEAVKWFDVIGSFKRKIDYDDITESIDNVTSAFFGTRHFSEDENGGLTVAVASVSDSDDSGAFSTAFTGAINTPHLYVNILDEEYDLLSSISAFDSAGLETFKALLASFLTACFFFGLFRSLPDIIMSAGRVVGITTDLDGVHVSDKETGEFLGTFSNPFKG